MNTSIEETWDLVDIGTKPTDDDEWDIVNPEQKQVRIVERKLDPSVRPGEFEERYDHFCDVLTAYGWIPRPMAQVEERNTDGTVRWIDRSDEHVKEAAEWLRKNGKL